MYKRQLLRRAGSVYKRYAPLTKPEEMLGDIETLLAEPDPL
uniref:Glutathione peroxidase n=1 Tax=Ralstonia solanacearum TaxID=305 RepID=A0A0S4VQ54_RALSL